MKHTYKETKTIKDFKQHDKTYEYMKLAGFVKKISTVIYDDITERVDLLPDEYYFNNDKILSFTQFRAKLYGGK